MVRGKIKKIDAEYDGGFVARVASLETNFINMNQRLDDLDAHIQQIFGAISGINTSLAGVGKIDWKTLIMSASTVALLLIAFTGAVVEPVKNRVSYIERDVEKHKERAWHEKAGLKIHSHDSQMLHLKDHMKYLERRVELLESPTP